MKKVIFCFALLLSLITVLPDSGQADDKIRDTILTLSYKPIEIDLPKCNEKIAVVKFTEEKPIKSLGQSKIFKYIPSQDIGSWIGKAVYDQLKSQGYDVQYFDSMYETGDMFIITGVANKVYINRPGQLEMEYKVQFDGMVTKGNKLIYAMNFTSKQEKEMMSTGDNAGKLTAGLHDTFGIFLPAALNSISNY